MLEKEAESMLPTEEELVQIYKLMMFLQGTRSLIIVINKPYRTSSSLMGNYLNLMKGILIKPKL